MKDIKNILDLYNMHMTEVRKMRGAILRHKLGEMMRPKKVLKMLAICAAIFAFGFLGVSLATKHEQYYALLAKRIDVKPIPSTMVVVVDSTKNHQAFLNHLAMFESSGNYNVVKTAGDYWGRYQIGPIARQSLGIVNIQREEFLANHSLQDGLVTALMQLNKRHLAPYIGKYEGRTIGGIYITQSGLLAGAHLGGSTNVIRWIESDGKEDFADGNGTKISKYIKRFTGYRLNL